MARAPRAHVSKTSGQGISRLAYQKGYALGNTGEQVPTARGGGRSSGGGRSYAKQDGDINIAFAGMFDLADAEGMDQLPQASVKLDRKPAKKLKGLK